MKKLEFSDEAWERMKPLVNQADKDIGLAVSAMYKAFRAVEDEPEGETDEKRRERYEKLSYEAKRAMRRMMKSAFAAHLVGWYEQGLLDSCIFSDEVVDGKLEICGDEGKSYKFKLRPDDGGEAKVRDEDGEVEDEDGDKKSGEESGGDRRDAFYTCDGVMRKLATTLADYFRASNVEVTVRVGDENF